MLRLIASLRATLIMPLLTVGCDAPRTLELDSDASVEEPPASRSAAMLATICPDERQVARLSVPGPCPAAGLWASTPIGDLPGHLPRHCVYEWTDTGAPDLTGLATTAGIAAVGADCSVVRQQATDPLTAELSDELQQMFRFAIGHASAADLELADTEQWRTAVMVAVVDTIPDPVPTLPQSTHGLNMMALVQDIACPDGQSPCAVDVAPVLGLPRVSDGDVDLANGGYYGSQSDLAIAVYDAVEQWQAIPGGMSTKLVINISAGWESEFGEVGSDAPAVDAVHAALEYASCSGALIIAAAGNEGQLCASGPLLPGAWESELAPGHARCAVIGVAGRPDPTGYAPLVHAVGGLGLDASMMPGTRDEGSPRLAAASTHAVVGDLLPAAPITGTSIAAAVGSGVAALVWSYNPDLDPAELMQVIYEGANPTTASASFHAPGIPDSTIRRINACAAIDVACDRPAASCPTMDLTCLGATPPVSIAQLFAELANVVTTSAPSMIFGTPPSVCTTCGDPGNGYVADGSDAQSCPVPIDPLLPYTLPQPTQIACPSCTIEPLAAKVYASLDPSYEGETITDVLVTVKSDTQTVRFGLGSVDISYLTTTTLELDPTLMPTGTCSATISITFADLDEPVVDEVIVR